MSGYQGNPLNPYASASPWGAYGSNMLTPWASAWSSYSPGAMQIMPQWQSPQWQMPLGQVGAPVAQPSTQALANLNGSYGAGGNYGQSSGQQQQQPSLFDQSTWLGPAQSMWLQGQGASDFDVLRAGLNVPGLSDEGRANIYQALQQQYGYGQPSAGYSGGIGRPNYGGPGADQGAAGQGY